mgnify:FL=1
MIGLVFMITFIFSNLLYLPYSIFKTTGDDIVFKLHLYLCVPVIALFGMGLRKFGWYVPLINALILLISILLSFGALKMLIKFIP